MLDKKTLAYITAESLSKKFCSNIDILANPVESPRVNLIKVFWSKITHTFCKLDHFINISNICCIGMKRSSLQNRLRKFTPKKFYEIDS